MDSLQLVGSRENASSSRVLAVAKTVGELQVGFIEHVQESQKTMAEMMQMIRSQNAIIMGIQAELHGVKESHKAEKEALEGEVRELKSEKDDLTKRVEELEKAFAKIDSLETKVAAVEKQTASDRVLLHAVNGISVRTQDTLKAHKEQLDRVEDIAGRAQAGVLKTDMMISLLEAQIKLVSTGVAEKEEEVKRLQLTLADVRGKAESAAAAAYRASAPARAEWEMRFRGMGAGAPPFPG